MKLSELQDQVTAGVIDTVIVAMTDHYGRTLGKRFDASFFIESVAVGSHACDYLLTADMEMEPVEGYSYSSWEGGYGDFHMVPDLDTLRPCGWAPQSAIVLCDIVDDSLHENERDAGLVPVAPRSILRDQVERATQAGYSVKSASELEFFLYRESYRDAHAKGYANLESAGWYNEDYHLLQGARVEDYVGAARRMLRDSEIPVENSKGEAAVGQHELNIRYADVLDMADRHVILKHSMKELADRQGVAVTFMAKPHADQSGSSCHMHLSLWGNDDGAARNVFAGPDGPSDEFRWFLGGWMAHVADLMVCYAPTVNSYKRYQSQSWAPTKIAWSTDNRTAGFRIVGAGPSLRIECRLPGADVNPYLAYAAALASGLDGIANKTEPPPEFHGDAYVSDEIPTVPTTLTEALDRFHTSEHSRRLLGDTVVDHYSHFMTMERDAYAAAVTDWERRRYFERI